MPTLRADARPIHHYRGGRLRAEPPLKAEPRLRAEPRVSAALPEPQVLGPSFEPETVPDEDLAGFERAAAAIHRASDVFKRPVAARAETDDHEADAPRLVQRLQAARPDLGARVKRAPAERRDPAPSRLTYKIERLWLTPLFRGFMRYGLPVILAGALVLGYLSSETRRARIGETFASLKSQVENRPEFMVKYMVIDGASAPVDSAIRQLATVPLPASSFQLDLDQMRDKIASIDAVESVKLKVKAGGILAVEVTERKPAVLWRTAGSLELLDATGHRVATLLDRSKRADLPVIAGPEADAHVPEALKILAAAQPVLPRVRGLVRQGDRRWDLVLDRDQVILLPEEGAVEAVERIMAIDLAEELLARDVAAVDLRNPERPTVRMNPTAVAAMQNMTEAVTKVAGE